MKKNLRRQRMVLRLRRRVNKGMELSGLEKLILNQTSTYRTLQALFPDSPDCIIRRVTDDMEA